jgi:hypothetical protein
MSSKFQHVSGLIAVGLFAIGVLVALSYPVNSKDKTDKAADPGSGLTSVRIGL